MTQTVDDTRQRVDLVGKLLARVLDPAAPEPEALNSAEKMVRVARRDGITLVDLMKFLAVVNPSRESAKRIERPIGADRILKFGKYCGDTLEQIGRADPNYLTWLADECSFEDIRSDAIAVEAWLNHLRDRETQ